MKPISKVLIVSTICLLTYQKTISQSISGDTTIVINKELANEILKKYSKVKDLKSDLIEDEAEYDLVTDRPHIAETPHLVPKGYLQWESGASFQNTKMVGMQLKEYTYNTTLFRLGLSRRVEARIETEYLGERLSSKSKDSSGKLKTGWAGINLASKVLICNNRGLLPKTSLLYGVSLPFAGSKDFKASHTAIEIKFLCLNRITKWYEFEYNFGVGFDGGGNNLYSYALNNEIELSRKLFVFLEMYGAAVERSDSENRFDGKFIPDHRINGGLWYIINPGLQLDLSGGFGLSPVSPQYYIAIGISNRLRIWK